MIYVKKLNGGGLDCSFSAKVKVLYLIFRDPDEFFSVDLDDPNAINWLVFIAPDGQGEQDGTNLFVFIAFQKQYTEAELFSTFHLQSLVKISPYSFPQIQLKNMHVTNW